MLPPCYLREVLSTRAQMQGYWLGECEQCHGSWCVWKKSLQKLVTVHMYV